MFELDHIAVAGETLDDAVAHSEAALGVTLGGGGQHTHYATHNRLLGLEEGLYFEAIAQDPNQSNPNYPRWFGLDDFRGPARLDKWILRCADISVALAAFPDIGRPVHLTRGDISWTMIVPDDGHLPFDGLFPAFIQWHTDKAPGATLPGTGLALDRLEICHPQADSLSETLAPYFSDDRVQFLRASDPSMTAIFDTPDGLRRLT